MCACNSVCVCTVCVPVTVCVCLTEWKEINSAMLKEENVRDNINRWFKEIANHYLPFLILEKNLIKLLEELSLAQDIQKNELLFQTLSSEEFRLALKHFFAQQNVDSINFDELILYIKESMRTHKQSIDFDFSINQIGRIIAQIYEKMSFDKDQIKKAASSITNNLFFILFSPFIYAPNRSFLSIIIARHIAFIQL